MMRAPHRPPAVACHDAWHGSFRGNGGPIPRGFGFRLTLGSLSEIPEIPESRKNDCSACVKVRPPAPRSLLIQGVARIEIDRLVGSMNNTRADDHATEQNQADLA